MPPALSRRRRRGFFRFATAEDEAGGKGRFPFEGNPTRALGFLVGKASEPRGLPAYQIILEAQALRDLQGNPYSDGYRRGTFIHGGQVLCDVGIRFRGQTSRYYPKHHWSGTSATGRRAPSGSPPMSSIGPGAAR